MMLSHRAGVALFSNWQATNSKHIGAFTGFHVARLLQLLIGYCRSEFDKVLQQANLNQLQVSQATGLLDELSASQSTELDDLAYA